MPHYKCVPCKTRLHSSGSPPEEVGRLCPDCGSLLEPVGELAEVVGFRAVQAWDGVAEAGALAEPASSADRIDRFLARRAAVMARARFESELPPHPDAGFAGHAVAMPWPEKGS
jgi:hypothetical protein